MAASTISTPQRLIAITMIYPNGEAMPTRAAAYAWGFSVQALDMHQFASHVKTVFNFMRIPVRYDEAELRQRMQPYIDLGIELLRRIPEHAILFSPRWSSVAL